MMLLFRIALPLILLAAAFAVMAADPQADDISDNWSDNRSGEALNESAEEALATLEDAAADMENAVAAAEQADEAPEESASLQLRQQRYIHVGKCDKTAWRLRAGTRERLKCDSVQLIYHPRGEAEGYDTGIVLQQGSDQVAWFGANWTDRDTLAVVMLQWDKGDWIPVQGRCTGRFDRPSEGLLTDGITTITFGRDKGEPRFSIRCADLADAGGKPLLSFAFTGK